MNRGENCFKSPRGYWAEAGVANSALSDGSSSCLPLWAWRYGDLLLAPGLTWIFADAFHCLGVGAALRDSGCCHTRLSE